MGKEKELLRAILANTEAIMAHLKISSKASAPPAPKAIKKPAAKKVAAKKTTQK